MACFESKAASRGGSVVCAAASLFLVCALLIPSAAATRPDGDVDATSPEICSDGCPGVRAVCGEDGFTYSNECLALCGQVIVRHAGPCHQSRGDADATTSRAVRVVGNEGRAQNFTSAQIERFRATGYRLLGAHDDTNAADDEGATPPLQKASMNRRAARRLLLGDGLDAGQDAPEGQRPGDNLIDLRLTMDGLLYARASIIPDNSSAPCNATDGCELISPPFLVDPATARQYNKSAAAPAKAPPQLEAVSIEDEDIVVRGDQVFGYDSRSEITSVQTSLPYSSVGQLMVDMYGNGEYTSCTAAVISRWSILTAAHCIQEDDGHWARGVWFYPSVTRYDTYGLGEFSADYMNTWTGWVTVGGTKYDFAVVTMTEPVGSYTGWMGMLARSGTMDQLLYTAGYPGDKPTDSYWWTSCSGYDTTPDDGVLIHKCDGYPGTSGAPMWQKSSGSNRYIRAVDVAYTDSYSLAMEISSDHFYAIQGWSS